MNFNVVAMKNGIKRFALERSDGILRALRVSVVNFSQWSIARHDLPACKSGMALENSQPSELRAVTDIVMLCS